MYFCRRYGNSTIQTLLSLKEGGVAPSEGSSQRITIVPPLSSAWFSDIVIPAVVVSIVVVVSLFAIIVLLLLRRHIGLEGHVLEGSSYHREDDRNALTPGSVRRLGGVAEATPPHVNCLRPPDHNNHHNGGIVMHVGLHHQQQQQREELFLC